MKYWIKPNDQGRIGASFVDNPMGEETDALYVDVPAEFVPETQRDWKMVDGALVYDPIQQQAPAPDPVAALEAQNTLLTAQVQALTDRGEFLEDCIAEMAVQVYGG